jgi:hypothetical protein
VVVAILLDRLLHTGALEMSTVVRFNDRLHHVRAPKSGRLRCR